MAAAHWQQSLWRKGATCWLSKVTHLLQKCIQIVPTCRNKKTLLKTRHDLIIFILFQTSFRGRYYLMCLILETPLK